MKKKGWAEYRGRAPSVSILSLSENHVRMGNVLAMEFWALDFVSRWSDIAETLWIMITEYRCSGPGELLNRELGDFGSVTATVTRIGGFDFSHCGVNGAPF